MKTYKTSEVANIIGMHANTVRLYESYKLIPEPKRNVNGYRIFTDHQIKAEQRQAEEAIVIVYSILSGDKGSDEPQKLFLRQEAADYLHVTIDTLRNW